MESRMQKRITQTSFVGLHLHLHELLLCLVWLGLRFPVSISYASSIVLTKPTRIFTTELKQTLSS